MSEDENAVICVLMLRGPQTPGELKQRAERMHPFADLDAVHDTLTRLIERELIARLERRPGQKEERYAQLLEDPDAPEIAGEGERGASSMPARSRGPGGQELGANGYEPHAGPQGDLAAELEALRERVARLEHEVAELRGGASREPRARAARCRIRI